MYDKIGKSAEVVSHYERGLALEHVPSDRGVSYPLLFHRLAVHCKNTGDWEKVRRL